MKNSIKKCRVLFIFLVLLVAHSTSAQSNYKIKASKDINMKLSGTSTLHDWEMTANSFIGEAQFNFDTTQSHQLTSLKALTFSLATENLKSDDKALDNNAYKALKTDEYKDIIYKLVTAKVVQNKKNSYVIKTHGNLSIAGVTRAIAMDVYCNVNKDSTISCSCSKKLRMSDYEVEPPSFMLGAMKTGDDITLDFLLIYTNETSIEKIF